MANRRLRNRHCCFPTAAQLGCRLLQARQRGVRAEAVFAAETFRVADLLLLLTARFLKIFPWWAAAEAGVALVAHLIFPEQWPPSSVLPRASAHFDRGELEVLLRGDYLLCLRGT